MQRERLIVKYITVQNCFVYLPEVWAHKLERKTAGIKLQHTGHYYYISWRLLPGFDNLLGISATFARVLQIKEGDEVIISSIPDPPFLSSITVTPRNSQDWEIVKCQADRIQSILLDQISLTAKNQPIIVWISKGLWVTLSIDSIYPDFVYGSIGNHTEVHVSSITSQESQEKLPKTSNTKIEQFKLKTLTVFRDIELKTQAKMSQVPNNGFHNEGNDFQSWLKKNDSPTVPRTFSVYNLSALNELYSPKPFDFHIESPYDVFVHESSNLTNCINLDGTEYQFYKIRKLCEDRQNSNTTNIDFLRKDSSDLSKISTELIVRLFVIKKEFKQCNGNIEKKLDLLNSFGNKIYVPTNLKLNLRLRIGSKVILERAERCDQSLQSITIFPSNSLVTKRDFINFVSNTTVCDEILLNSRTKIYFNDGTSCKVVLAPEDCSYVVLDAISLKQLTINVSNITLTESEVSNESDNDIQDINLDSTVSRHLDTILDECRIALELSFGLIGVESLRYDSGNILICGDVGVGKSTFAKILMNELHKSPHFVYTHTIECKPLKGKKVEAMQKIMMAAMVECIYFQPSILFLDDLESITSSPSDEEGNTPDAINAARILDVIMNISAEYQSSYDVSILATCTNIHKIGAKLRSPRGVHFFTTVLTIPDLAKEHRIEILKRALQNHVHVTEDINWDYYGNKTDGWVAQDLVDFAEKAAFAAWKRQVQSQSKGLITVTEADLRDILQNYKIISLHGVQIHKNENHDLSHIGGLTKAKEMLRQLLGWPLKYPELYRDAPIKNQNGVLLFGMPGTGKTILAGAIAKECGLNLISVKGPELLSKYIGASEEAVRNIFEKARRAKPCVLFFDEFESLAPRRGHDNTGVTDRVVNQLLTQLDGVEGREEVAVVAASSRPDLLDPALLRPGRLDKSLLCPLPDENDREEILYALCKVQGIDSKNLDLKEVAKLSANFTGADLAATLMQAKFIALESTLANEVPDEPTCGITTEVTQQNIIESLKSTSPSLTFAEKEKYNKIYHQFLKGTILVKDLLKQKATLA